MKMIAAALGGCVMATVLFAPIASADNGPPQGPLELPDKHGERHVLRQDQAVGGANPDVPYGTNPFGRDENTVIGGADPSTPVGTDPLVPYGTWQN